MNKAFLFDMDGVIVNSEYTWHHHGKDFAKSLYGEDIVEKMGDTTGTSLDYEYAFATRHGFSMDLEEFYKRYDEQAAKMYAKTTITKGLEELVYFLKEMEFRVGIVSSSRRPWIDMVLSKIGNKNLFNYILSLNEKGLPSKPDPQGFLKAMEDLSAAPHTTVILEDSNNGILAARESGAFTIAFTPLLVKGYKQIQADRAANSYEDVKRILTSFTPSL